MSLTTRVTRDKSRATELENALKRQFNMLHSAEFWDDYEIETLLLEQQSKEVGYIKERFPLPKGLVIFSPSSAGKCKREMFYKANRAKKDADPVFPYRKRWTLNSTAVHAARQRDLLYSEKLLLNPSFTVERMPDGLPAWEKNIQQVKIIEHNGITFGLFGMCDGILHYKDGSRIIFEFKTKSTKQDGVVKLKKPAPSHILQTIAYSILFSNDELGPVTEALITYESVAKDEWRSGAWAIDDIKPFHNLITDEDRTSLLDKWAEVAEMVEDGEMPARETSKCMFCPYKNICLGGQS